MGYVKIKEESEDVLHLCREPSQRAWAILVGCTSLGLGAAYCCNDYLIWKLLYVAGAVFVGVTCFETWEECIFDKKEKQVRLKTQNIFQKAFSSASSHVVSADLNDLVNVNVSEEEVKYAGKGYIVVLYFESGIKLGVTETASFGDKSDHEAIAQKIYQFNELDKKAEAEKMFAEDLIGDMKEQIADSSDTDFEEKEDSPKQVLVSEETPVAGITNIEGTESSEKISPEVETISPVTESPATTEDHAETPNEVILPQEPSSVPVQPQDADNGSSSDESFEKIDKSAVEDFEEEKSESLI